MLFLFFTEISLALIIVYTAFKFNTYNLDMKANYDESDGLWLFFVPRYFPESMFSRTAVKWVKIGIFIF